jgi:dihydroorotate dehydrogenase (fumarate)
VTADLSTRYLGLDLRSPVVASSSPLTGEVASAVAIARAGAGALVMPSLWEEEVLEEELALNRGLETGSEHFAEALTYFPAVDELMTAADRYCQTLSDIKRAIDIPVIASLNASSAGGWIHYAKELADAGADALELNLYHVVADPRVSGTEVEARDIATIQQIRAEVDVPLAVKLSPYYASFTNFGLAAVEAGADGLVLFNRFYQPDLDMDSLGVVASIELSSPWELRLPLRWIAILRAQLASQTSLAATSGVHQVLDVVKALAVGADVAMMTSALLRHGPEHISTVITQLSEWLDDREYISSDQLRGSMSYRTTDDPATFERAQYYRALHSWTTSNQLSDFSAELS